MCMLYNCSMNHIHLLNSEVFSSLKAQSYNWKNKKHIKFFENIDAVVFFSGLSTFFLPKADCYDKKNPHKNNLGT